MRPSLETRLQRLENVDAAPTRAPLVVWLDDAGQPDIPWEDLAPVGRPIIFVEYAQEKPCVLAS
jgi:hypothetical protein